MSVPLRAGYMQGVTPVGVVEIDLDVLLQQELNDIDLVLSRRYEQ